MTNENLRTAIREILYQIGEDIEREGIKATPTRVTRLYNNFFYGYKKKLVVMDEKERNTRPLIDIIPITVFKNETQGMVIRNTKFISFCEHHIVPFSGTCWVGIIPDKHMLGMNKIDKIIKYFAARLQVQERLTAQVADWIMENIKPKGVIVVVNATHFCAELQGDNGDFTTSEVRGIFLDDNNKCKEEFMNLIK